MFKKTVLCWLGVECSINVDEILMVFEFFFADAERRAGVFTAVVVCPSVLPVLSVSLQLFYSFVCRCIHTQGCCVFLLSKFHCHLGMPLFVPSKIFALNSALPGVMSNSCILFIDICTTTRFSEEFFKSENGG